MDEVATRSPLKARVSLRVYRASSDEWVALGMTEGGRWWERLAARLRIWHFNRKQGVG